MSPHPSVFLPQDNGAQALIDHWKALDVTHVHMVTNGNFARQKDFPQTIPTTLGAGQLTFESMNVRRNEKHAFFISLDSDQNLRQFHDPQNHPEQTGLDEITRTTNIVQPLYKQFGEAVMSVDALLYDGEMDQGVLRAAELYQLKDLTDQAGICFASTPKLGSYGLPTHAKLGFAELFETVYICPYPNKTGEVPTFLDRAVSNEKAANLPALDTAQGEVINLYNQPLGLVDSNGNPLLDDEQQPIILEAGSYLDADLPHTPLFPVQDGIKLTIS